MSPRKLLSLFLSFCLILEQSLFAQEIDLSRYFVRNSGQNITQSDKFRPLHLRYLGYDNLSQDFKILLDKGDAKKEDLENKAYIEENTQILLKYFFVGLSLPNEKFWVNLRPDSPDNILDPDLEKTDIGRIFLEADLQLKKDTSSWTSPQTPEGKAYWDKLYKKAGELFPAAGGSAFGGGSENIAIPTITRPWIVPGEIIIREAPDNAYIYKATLKVMLEEDYLDQKTEKPKNIKIEAYNFQDQRLKELNQYSTQLIKETIIPKLTYEVNTSKRYAQLRQVYYSLILAQWFKQKYGSSESTRAPGTRASGNSYLDLIDSGNLTNLISKEPYDKQTYFKQYQKSFKDGEYNLQEPVYTPMGQSIRRYISGGGQFGNIMDSASPIRGQGEVSSAITRMEFLLKSLKSIEVGWIELKNDRVFIPPEISSSPMDSPSASSAVEDQDKERLWSRFRDYMIDLAERETYLLAIQNFYKKIADQIQKWDKLKSPKEDARSYFKQTLIYLDVIDAKWSNFFRHMDTFKNISKSKHFENIVKERLVKFRQTRTNQVINVAVIGAAYGQEPISAAIHFSERIKNILSKERDASVLKKNIVINIHVIDKPDMVYDKLKNNEIVYPEELMSYFEEEEKGLYFTKEANSRNYIRSPELEKRLKFYDVELTNPILSATHRIWDMDVVMVHNILQHVKSKRNNISQYLHALLKPGGILSIITPRSYGNPAIEKMLKSKRYLVLMKREFFNMVDGIYVKQPDVSSIDNDKDSIVSLTSSPSTSNDKGGIAFNALPIQTESVASSALGALSGVRAFSGDLDAEWAQIQAVFNSGIRPSVQRLVDFAAAGAASPMASQRREDVLGLVAELLRRDEEDARLAPIDPTLKDLLNALESLS